MGAAAPHGRDKNLQIQLVARRHMAGTSSAKGALGPDYLAKRRLPRLINYFALLPKR
jgi:hypothetical protein